MLYMCHGNLEVEHAEGLVGMTVPVTEYMTCGKHNFFCLTQLLFASQFLAEMEFSLSPVFVDTNCGAHLLVTGDLCLKLP